MRRLMELVRQADWDLRPALDAYLLADRFEALQAFRTTAGRCHKGRDPSLTSDLGEEQIRWTFLLLWWSAHFHTVSVSWSGH